MKISPAVIALSMIIVMGFGFLGVLSLSGRLDPTGEAVRRSFIPKAPVQQKYCSGYQHGLEACFQTKEGLKPFKCDNYYWVPTKGEFLKCCLTYFDCRDTGQFRLASFCDQKTRLCKLQ